MESGFHGGESSDRVSDNKPRIYSNSDPKNQVGDLGSNHDENLCIKDDEGKTIDSQNLQRRVLCNTEHTTTIDLCGGEVPRSEIMKAIFLCPS